MKLVYTVGLRLTAFLRECSNHSYRKMKIPLISLINSIKNGLNNNSNKIIVKLSRTNIKLLDILVAERFIVSYTIIKKSIIVTLGSAGKLNSSIRELAVLSKPERNVIIKKNKYNTKNYMSTPIFDVNRKNIGNGKLFLTLR